MATTKPNPYLPPRLGMNHGLLKDMMAIIAKYDKEFPESDEVDLENLSISQNRGFLEMLPSKKTLWPTKISVNGDDGDGDGDDDDDVVDDDVKKLPGVKKEEGISLENVLSNTALDCFLEGVIAEETSVKEEVGEDKLDDVNCSQEDEDGSLEVDGSDETLSIASGTCDVKNSSKNIKATTDEEPNDHEDETENQGKKYTHSHRALYEVLKEEKNDREENFKRLIGNKEQGSGEEERVSGIKSKELLKEFENNEPDPVTNQIRTKSSTLFQYNAADQSEGQPVPSGDPFGKIAPLPLLATDSECESTDVKVRGWLFGNRKRKLYEHSELSPSKLSRIQTSSSPTSSSTKGYQEDGKDPESPSCRRLLETWKSQLNIHSDAAIQTTSPVRLPVTPKQMFTPNRHLVEDMTGSPTSLSSKRSYHHPNTKNLQKTTSHSNIEKPHLHIETHLDTSDGEVNELSLFADPFDFQDSKLLPESFTPKHNSTMIAKPLSDDIENDGSVIRTPSKKRRSELTKEKKRQLTKDKISQRIKFSSSTVITNEKIRMEKTNSWEVGSSDVGEVERETKPWKADCVDNRDRTIPHNQLNCKKIFCLKCCHSPGRNVEGHF